jgi:tetratricopeptide (TPR) repeat protein
MGVAIVTLVIGVPALVFVLWPMLSRREGGRALLAVPADAREQLQERKRQALRALRELAFEHEAGHVSDDDFADLRARYEAEAAEVLGELDRLGEAPAPRARETPQGSDEAAASRAARGWRHPLALGTGAIALVVFGVGLGVGIVRYTEPDASAGTAMSGPGPLAGMPPPGGSPEGRGSAPEGRTLAPEMLRGMLQAARTSLFEGRYGEAIAAYQAVLKRDPKNVDAMTHMGLIVALGGHTDAALETFDRALSIDAAYAPALLYRGQVLYENRKDVPGAIASWERYLAVTPPGADRQRVEQLIAEARKKAP